MWTSAYPSGFQPYRKTHTNIDLWVLAGYDRKYITSYMNSQSTSYNHPNSAIEPRIPASSILQHRGRRTGEGLRRQGDRAAGRRQHPAAWEKLTDKLGRENQVKYYRIAMGL